MTPVDPEQIPMEDARWGWFKAGWEAAVDELRKSYPDIEPYKYSEPTLSGEKIYEIKRELEYTIQERRINGCRQNEGAII